MPKISFDEGLWHTPQFSQMCEMLGCSRAEGIGLVAVFWDDTRRAGFGTGRRSRLADYLPRKEGAYEALVAGGILEPEDGDNVTVVANQKYFSTIAQRSLAGKKGRVALTGAARKRKEQRSAAAPASRLPAKRATQSVTKTTEAQAANRRCWEAYRVAYNGRYGVEPLRNARTNACIAQFVQKVGYDMAPAVMNFYLAHNDVTYVRSSHAITFAVRDAEGLYTQWRRDEAVTSQDLFRRAQSAVGYDQLARIDRGDL